MLIPLNGIEPQRNYYSFQNVLKGIFIPFDTILEMLPKLLCLRGKFLTDFKSIKMIISISMPGHTIRLGDDINH